MIRQSAFENQKKMLKGALHSHTTRSDGLLSPAEVIALHEKNGYDFMAITDHRIYNFQNHLPQSRMTILPGVEVDMNFDDGNPYHCFHAVWLGHEKPHNPYEQDQVFPGGQMKDQFEFQKHLDEAHASGHLTMLCHPQWSCTFTREFEQLKGNFAMELWNSGGALDFDMDVNNGWIWDELLMQGQRIYGTAVDDGHEDYQHCQGWVMVNADNNVDAILSALQNGDFYSSTGPEIYDFWIDDDHVAHVKCSPCRHVRFICAAAAMGKVYAEHGKPIMEATGRVPVYCPYLRVEVTDLAGRVAWSNPIFIPTHQ